MHNDHTILRVSQRLIANNETVFHCKFSESALPNLKISRHLASLNTYFECLGSSKTFKNGINNSRDIREEE